MNIRYKDTDIAGTLERFMNGESTLEEERLLGEYFRTGNVPGEWEDYRRMFAYFDGGMNNPQPEVRDTRNKRTVMRLMPRTKWLGAAAAILIGFFAVTTYLTHEEPQTTQVPQVAKHTEGDKKKEDGNLTRVEDRLTAEKAVEEAINYARAPHTANPKPQADTPELQTSNHEPQASSSLQSTLAQAQAAIEQPLEEAEAVEAEIIRCQSAVIKARMEAQGYQAVMTDDGDIVYVDRDNRADISI